MTQGPGSALRTDIRFRGNDHFQAPCVCRDCPPFDLEDEGDMPQSAERPLAQLVGSRP